MATTNGHPPASAPENTDGPRIDNNKRKREGDGTLPAHLDTQSAKTIQTQKDVLEILSQHDTDPSVLHHPLEPANPSEPSQKKARLSESSKTAQTISLKLDHGYYTSLNDLRKDAERVGEDLTTSIRSKAREREASQAGRMLVEDLKQIQRVQAFELVVKQVVEQERKYEQTHARGKEGALGHDVSNGTTGTKLARDGSGGKQSTVLTLFGNAPTPKQLFSSMQNARTEQASHEAKIELPVEEMNLPNGLNASKIMPLSADASQKHPTFEDVFAPAYHLPTMAPPRGHKRALTRDTTINWEFKDQQSRNSRKGGYTVQTQPVGDWLGWGGVDIKADPASPREKRKQRDRALSGGDRLQSRSGTRSSQETLLREEEALFRRAYSSFAPSCDNSKTLVSQETKNMMWWHKVGNKRFNETFPLDPALMEESPAPLDPTLLAEPVDLDGADLERTIEEFDFEEEMPDGIKMTDKTDVEQVLRQVSQLLETLASHQRIRNASLPSSALNSRNSISPNPSLAARVGKPDIPGDDEMSTYLSLRRELAYLVLRLPPYAVAKLDGDQLADVGVKTLINLENADIKGTMEEDQVARNAKYTAMATAAGIERLTRTSSGSNQHYSSANQRAPAIGQAANTRYGQSAAYGASRTPATQPQYQRSSNGVAYGTPAMNPRPGYSQPNQYSRPAPPQPAYGQPSGQPQYNRAVHQVPNGHPAYSQNPAQSTPQMQQRSTYPSSQPLAQYQQRSHVSAHNAAGYQGGMQAQPQQSHSPFPRNVSPAKHPAHSQGIPTPVQPRPVHQYAQPQQPTSGRETPVNYPSQPQTPVNGYQTRPAPPQQAAQSATPQPPPSVPQQAPPAQANGHAPYASTGPEPIATSTGASQPGGTFECGYCFKKFIKHSTFVVHERTHTGERPFICPAAGCGKEFTVRSNLTRHVATHAKDRGVGYDGIDEGSEQGVEEGSDALG